MPRSSEPDPRPDEQLVAAINTGSRDAFEVLYHRYRDWIVRLAFRFTENREDALDTLQETFTYFLNKFPGFTLTSRMTTFFYPAVKHIALRIKEKRKPYVSLQAEMHEESGTTENEAGNCAEAVKDIVASLPEAQQEVLLMRYVDGMRLQEIAQSLAVPLGTVKSRTHKALETLRNTPGTREYFGL